MKLKCLILSSFCFMIFVNIWADVARLNGRTTGEVSKAYPNIFAPAGVTFSIWIVIYLLLLGYVLYMLGLFREKGSIVKNQRLKRVGIVFSITSIANGSWIIAWHFVLIPLSAILIVVILVGLMWINEEMAEADLTAWEKTFVKVPFSVYFGWITVATIGNITVLLVYYQWDGFGIAEAIWAVSVMSLGMMVAVSYMLRTHNMFFGAVVMWGYLGILIRQMSGEAQSVHNFPVIVSVCVCLVILLLAQIYLVIIKRSLSMTSYDS